MPERAPFYYNAPEETCKLARRLRKRITKAEKKVWHELRRNNLKEYYFRRQHPIAWYIADFYCHKAKLVVELDGPSHDTEDMQVHDERRDSFMEGLEIKVLRFKNEEVFGNLDAVLEEIKEHLP